MCVQPGGSWVHPSLVASGLLCVPADHYTGLKDSWNLGPIYCSETTALLVQHMLGVSREWLRPLPLETPTMVQGGPGWGPWA
jgi:hypothetical protein